MGYEDREEVLQRTAVAMVARPTPGRSDARHLHVVWMNFQDVFPTWLGFLKHIEKHCTRKGIKVVAQTLQR